MAINVLAICGSLRKASYNRKALAVAKKIAGDLGAEVTEADLKELDLPIYDGDIEAEGFPAPVQRLYEMAALADAYIIATPEYNYSVPGALKNAIDWLSRGPKPMSGKIAAILGASTGAVGTARAQLHLRQILVDLNVLVLPSPQVLIRSAAEAFNPDGTFVDPQTAERMRKLLARTLELAEKLKGASR